MRRKRKRGLAAVPLSRRREISRMGGIAAQRTRRGHRWTVWEARAQRQAQLERKRREEEAELQAKARQYWQGRDEYANLLPSSPPSMVSSDQDDSPSESSPTSEAPLPWFDPSA